jgi:hypothetical protein
LKEAEGMINTGSSLNSDLTHAGYSLEERYIHDQERELREKQLRKIQDDSRARLRATQSGVIQGSAEAAAKMYCPQCNAEHRPTRLLGVDATECAQCHGIFLSEEQAKAIQDLSAGQASG